MVLGEVGGLASPPKEGVLWILSLLKIHRPQPGLNAWIVWPIANTLTIIPPKTTFLNFLGHSDPTISVTYRTRTSRYIFVTVPHTTPSLRLVDNYDNTPVKFPWEWMPFVPDAISSKFDFYYKLARIITKSLLLKECGRQLRMTLVTRGVRIPTV
jgi:hypothetical protein